MKLLTNQHLVLLPESVQNLIDNKRKQETKEEEEEEEATTT